VNIYLRGAFALVTAVVVAELSSISASPVSSQPVLAENEPHHQVMLKNDSVLVLRVKLVPGESTQFHTHLHDRVTVDLSDTTIVRQKLGEPESAPEATKPGDVTGFGSNGPYTHLVRNIGNSDFEALDVELLHRPTTASDSTAAKVEAKNPSARVYKWTLAPGTASPMHTHERPYLIISATPLVLKMSDPEGKSSTHEVKAGDFHWVDAKVTHSLANEGKDVAQIVEIELK
jgi:quercetin dioxygenase-like cupin family protein